MSFLQPLLLVVLALLMPPSQSTGFLDCSTTTYQCGGHSCEVSFPFRTPGMPDYCGHPELELACINESVLAINITGKEYQVNGIYYEQHLIDVASLDLSNQSCPRKFADTRLDLSLLDYTDHDRYVTVYVDCSNITNQPSPNLVSIDCLKNNSTGERQSYYSLSSKDGTPTAEMLKCRSTAVIPLFADVFDYVETGAMDFVHAVGRGFELIWIVGKLWCDGCNRTGGVCGFNRSLPDEPLCFCADGRTTSGKCFKVGKKNVRKTIALASAVGGVVALIAACCVFFFWYKPRKRLQQSVLSNLPTQSTSSKFSSMNGPELAESKYQTHIFSYEELQEATNGFDASRELGDGGFGTVYKGKLRDGRTVAVKRLYENNYKRVEQFMNEVDILSRLRHQNLVTLYGCTSRHSRELLLVYEFVANGTVADHLHGAHASSGPLLWQDRMSIAIETADALAYLHAVEPPIIHRDVKSNNILLDNNFHVKVADFGLSRLFPLDATHVSTAPQGTPGYVDPEYHQCYQLTDRSDVYSFGVVLVELISSKPAVDIRRSRHEINLANMAVNMIQKCQLEQLVDPALGYHSDLGVKGMITQVAELAFTCLQSDGDLRPSIKEVLEELRRIHSRVQTDDQPLKEEEASLFSPDSVAERWNSR
ncbi:LEAF RUST 10 DISEASE-RESISTANCE LOCUS RECEPTOR-LIKE PROTEIN KINASE-like 1.2 isoform X2 [Iris pallida]|uniref:non-specific serine/threonine protein kinase n=1 Tax=Iris pallida TaxID=29817 RepID=A0AAX6GZI4_IRIPA|nr:LEAF RUST 10 DISEASE-RESISTANCE LOCUS RECEPTOR-LIKE PROTEIN KINASE-like 1.2 isoform X2 [Iris pallida]